MSIQCIINADDFGYSKGVNLGILEAFQHGVVTSATMMVNMPGAEHAFQLAKEYPELGVGIHFVLTCGKPIRSDVPSLINENGEFRKRDELFEYADVVHIERELTAQLETFFSFGLMPTHIDSHHHVHAHERIFPIVKKLAKQYDLPIRQVLHLREKDLRTVDVFIHQFYGDRLTTQYFLSLLEQIDDGQTVEVMCHPAYIDLPLINGSSYCFQRANELAILTDREVREALLKRNVELITYREWKNKSYI
jgi:predicted glycoside hydrolase/deacetylase ChbG (UPF0249 family)